jgi:hypothetical protein
VNYELKRMRNKATIDKHTVLIRHFLESDESHEEAQPRYRNFGITSEAGYLPSSG